MKRRTKQQRLEQLIAAAGRHDVTVEFQPFRGWYLCGEPRWMGDDGRDYLGANFQQAQIALVRVL